MLADLETQANSASSGNEFQEDSDSEEEQMEEQDFDSIFGQEQPKSEEKQPVCKQISVTILAEHEPKVRPLVRQNATVTPLVR